jgi:tetratricopeptide (TPR) repeat protein
LERPQKRLKNKSLIIGLVFFCLLVIAGLGGYLIGLKSSGARFAGSSYRDAGPADSRGQAESSVVIEELKAAVKANPGSPELLIRLGDAYFEATKFSDAVTAYKKALDLKPDDPFILNNIGLATHYMGNSAEGLKFVDDAIKKDPYQQRIWLTKGFILSYGLGDLAGAASAWEKAVAINPDSQVGKAAADYLAKIRSGGTPQRK